MRTGIVVIGRNEGQRLVACLRSLAKGKWPIVYVDSGSSDGSPEQAQRLGAVVVALDMSIPFSAARARNAGLAKLDELWPGLTYVQFIDGDCIMVIGWLPAGETFLDDHNDVAVVCGRRRESYPHATIYNRLCDMEWDTPVGETTACGGDALMRLSAIRAVHGYRDELIAGEEPELCLRLREKGWRIWRLPVEMTLHDANIRRFGQWWKRTMRGGYAYAAVNALHSGSGTRIWQRELWRAVIWGMILPLVILIASAVHPAGLALLSVYPLQVARLATHRGGSARASWRYGIFMTLAKFAESAGVLKYFISQAMRRRARVIEYK